ncbi:MAG: type 4a pilus biogenesis protein PilO [Gammaproteobacteria bacterium]|nr:type 4a pilus biogenesis protein PilO [Gammaproteobacteria bacterium]
MTKSSLPYKIIGMLIFLSITSIAYHFSLHPSYSNYLDSHHAYHELKQNIDKLKVDLGKKGVYSTQFTQTQALYNQTMAVFPKDLNTALNGIKKSGESAHLTFQSITPGTPVSKNFYSEIPVQLTILGTYKNIMDFMQTGSTGTIPLFIWKNWTLSQQEKPKTTVLNETTSRGLLQMNVSAIFFTMP